MREIKIKCPTCGKVLRLADAPNINQATFICPICKDKHVVSKCQRFMDTPANSVEDTQYGSKANSKMHGSEETQIADGMNGGEETRIATSHQVAGCLVDAFGREYRLHQGINTIGRQAQSSSATLQIQTNDHYMSRSHAIIEVWHEGSKTVHLLKNGSNKNPSYLNGTLIIAGDQLVLNNGDRMTFGKTELTFNI